MTVPVNFKQDDDIANGLYGKAGAWVHEYDMCEANKEYFKDRKGTYFGGHTNYTNDVLTHRIAYGAIGGRLVVIWSGEKPDSRIMRLMGKYVRRDGARHGVC